MTYSTHLRLVIAALQAARPELSNKDISEAAGLGHGWVSHFLRGGRANLMSAQRVVEAAARMAPAGSDGEQLRQLLRAFDDLPKAPETGVAA